MAITSAAGTTAETRLAALPAVEAFRSALQQRHVAVSVRASRGLDADAACGQLANKNEPALKDGERIMK